MEALASIFEDDYAAEEITCVRARPTPSLAQILENHESTIQATARSLLSPRVAVEDLEQEGRIALWKASQVWRGDGGCSVWVYARRSVIRQMVKCVLRAKREAAGCELEPDDCGDTDRDTDTLYIREAIDTLSEGMRTTVTLALAGFTFAEIGEQLRCSEETARRLYHAAVEYLRVRL